jgi:phosphatidylcholine synthase
MDGQGVDDTVSPPKASPSRLGAAWAVHALTASGAVVGLLAMLAVIRGDARGAMIWLGVALAIDGLDGPMARKIGVRDVLPRFDGALLDLIVDYLTYVLVPALFIYWFELLPPGWGLYGAGYILLTSLYCFANLDLKTHDNYFVGFPGIWNVVALYMFVLPSLPWLNAAIVFALGILTFVPIKFVHPLRVKELRDVTLVATIVWALSSFALIFFHPKAPGWLVWCLLGASAWLGFVSLRRTLRGATPE